MVVDVLVPEPVAGEHSVREPALVRARAFRAAEWAVVVSAALTVGTAPIEGSLMAVHPQAVKIPAVLLVGSWLVLRFWFRTRGNFHPVHVLLTALATTVLASTALHLSGQFALQYAIRWVPFLVTAAILVDVASREIKVRLILAASVVGAVLAGSGGLFSVIVSGERRATGPLEDPNDLAYVLVAALPLVVALELGGRWWNVARVVLVGVLALGAAATFSRGGAMAAAVAVIWLIARGAISLRTLLTAAAGVLVAAVTVAAFAASTLVAALGEKQYIAGSNVDSRLIRWQAAARLLGENPVLGVGPGGFREHYAAASGLAEIAEQTPVTHNMYLEVGAELGTLGLLLFVGVIFTALVSTELALRAGADHRTVVAIQASLLAVIVASVFLSQQYYMSLWSMVAAACALHLRHPTQAGG
ncbi:O-antigen ligase family protein [Rhodococcus sp. IEGM 1408]|uniref:O-antigen ligase family protein n=1 Tax=Rhodococcus sp. IEGM 1408 TaxID=3082220 RepID=UPI002953F90A|nr:O-antigen ligase family protein [Rhodococcus sp. IEGM 1408]MDV8002532.1 O-antigen ligase family protein [Rhodococcus sp. IEGM 1408]